MTKGLRQVLPRQDHLVYGHDYAAAFLGISEYTFRNLRKEGKIAPPVGKHGKNLVFDKADLLGSAPRSVQNSYLGERSVLRGDAQLAHALGVTPAAITLAKNRGMPYVTPIMVIDGVSFYLYDDVNEVLQDRYWRGKFVRRRRKATQDSVTKFKDEPKRHREPKTKPASTTTTPLPARYTLGYKGLGAYLGLSAPSAMQWAEKLGLGKRAPGEKSAVYDLDAVDAAIQSLPYGQQARLIAKGWVAGDQAKLEGEKLEGEKLE